MKEKVSAENRVREIRRKTRKKRGGPHCLDSAAAELRWTLRFIVRLPKSVAGSPHRRRSG